MIKINFFIVFIKNRLLREKKGEKYKKTQNQKNKSAKNNPGESMFLLTEMIYFYYLMPIQTTFWSPNSLLSWDLNLMK